MEHHIEKELIDYVIADVASKAGINVRFEYLSPDLQLKVRMAISDYKKMRALRSMIAECEKKVKKMFIMNKAQVLKELENYKKEYKEIEDRYQQTIEEIASRLRQTSISETFLNFKML